MGNLKLSIVIEFVHKLNIESCSNEQACLLVAINCMIYELMYVFYRQVTEARRHQLYHLHELIMRASHLTTNKIKNSQDQNSFYRRIRKVNYLHLSTKTSRIKLSVPRS